MADLKKAWGTGASGRPTDERRETAPRGRRRPDPLVDVTEELEQLFAEDPTRSGRQLTECLQARFPGQYPDALLRTIQRRLKGWRARAVDALYAPALMASPLPPDRAAMGIDA
ncbi:hypothetical protein [Nguyenibacter vanlangensis]|uniref:hypothetical protein n=1 Tax=Nguyenibacter vanlangensis TaxID=1216886 RepID=UPI001C4008B9|nr:hypothetical protein [Nguyenibacter vanlangensis]